MKLTLPPKRFEDARNPKFDAIKHKSWYHRLYRRREQIPRLMQAAKAWLGGQTQAQACIDFGLDPRELRDYVAFYFETHAPLDKNIQKVFDEAYGSYCSLNAFTNYRWFLEKNAPFWGMKPRHVTEIWEVNPTAYPTGYL